MALALGQGTGHATAGHVVGELPHARQALIGINSGLNFAQQLTSEGTLWQRLIPHDESSSVGAVQLSRARGASASLLSLLALDPRLAACDLSRALYFDTETTGLGGAGSLAFLIGVAWFTPAGTLTLEQLLLRDPGEERAQLKRLFELVSEASMLVSFNGKAFDWPLLKDRALMNRLNVPNPPPHLDLLHVSRRLHRRRLERFRLIDLETEVLGFERGSEDIPGAEIPPLYAHFLRCRDEEILRPVVEHNAWDVLTMAALTGLYGESLEELTGSDLLGLTETLTRAKSFDAAEVAVGRALEGGEDPHALSQALALRARLRRARGDKARALSDYARLSEQVDDQEVRFELAKLYEHYEKDFERALLIIDRGTGETPEAHERRRARLVRRKERAGLRPPGR